MDQNRSPRTRTPTVISVTSDDDRYAATRKAAAALAEQEGAELILYDWDSATVLGDPLPSVWSAEGTDKDVPELLDEGALEAAGRHPIAQQVEQAKASGLSASAWLPSEKGTEALLKFAQEHGAVAIVVPADFEDLPDDGSPIRIVRA